MNDWIKLPNSSKEEDVIFINSDEIWLTKVDDKLIAISNICPHRLGPLNLGSKESGRFVYCPWHGYKFDLRTKECVNHSLAKLLAYDIKNIDGALWIRKQ